MKPIQTLWQAMGETETSPLLRYDEALGCPVIVGGRGDFGVRGFTADTQEGERHGGVVVSYNAVERYEIGTTVDADDDAQPFLAIASPSAASLRVWGEAFLKAAERLEGASDE